MAQFSRLYVGHVRAGSLAVQERLPATRGRVVVRAILANGQELDFPGELVDSLGSKLVRFDPVPPEVHAKIARLVSGG